MSVIILGIESSCDDTSVAVVKDGVLLANQVAGQKIHERYGGVVPELASRAHQENIVPLVDVVIKDAGISLNDVSAIAFTRGPGLLGALLVGTSFAKGLSIALNRPLIDINHLQAHVLVHFIKHLNQQNRLPEFPMLCLLVSGGHTQIVLVKDYLDMVILGQTIDDAAGEAFDKCAKVLGLGYPGGPKIDELSRTGNPKAFLFSKPKVSGLDFSFSGLKTSFLYFLQDKMKENPDFINQNINDLCASLQHTIIEILMDNFRKAIKETGIRNIAISGGVAANSGLREAVGELGKELHAQVFIPEKWLTTDNAAMVAITGYFKYLKGDFATHDLPPLARMPF
ncbi:MAG TPA: tRNA (adenosine(37)-N6)-threonylcarbamoyltransferase complex transferase subunit TsaD [Salinivirgaceae bacterium]|nr:tRNA (adenosine(37)-N6)-threonylcarbamoyltransferase complex transferase subunit TsaD [Salinivirgaceae bacterium]